MLIVCLDDEQRLLDALMRSVREASPDATVLGFRNATEAFEEIRGNGLVPDIAFLDIEMPGINGLELARLLKLSCADIHIIFVTGFSEYAVEAFAIRACGYVMKPVSTGKIKTELQNLQNPPERKIPEKPVKIQCFGNFEVFVEGAAIPYRRSKSKEMLAYLVDRRGTACSSAEIAGVLWDDGVFDHSRQKQLQVFRSELLKSLKDAGIDYILSKTGSGMAVNPDTFDCDYYMALAGDSVAINRFSGEYMSQYTWAEYTVGKLHQL